jgi:hypothetical protein
MDIIILIFLCIRIRNIVRPKGYNTSNWILRTVLLWIGAEILGFLGSSLLQADVYVALLSGLLCAVASYFYVQNKALQLPDLNKIKDQEQYEDAD